MNRCLISTARNEATSEVRVVSQRPSFTPDRAHAAVGSEASTREACEDCTVPQGPFRALSESLCDHPGGLGTWLALTTRAALGAYGHKTATDGYRRSAAGIAELVGHDAASYRDED